LKPPAPEYLLRCKRIICKNPTTHANRGTQACTTNVLKTASSFKTIPGIKIVSRKSNLTYTTELIAEPVIVAVTSPKVEHGIIAPVTPATYVKTKIAAPLIQVA
jgi:hypothetical protein